MGPGNGRVGRDAQVERLLIRVKLRASWRREVTAGGCPSLPGVVPTWSDEPASPRSDRAGAGHEEGRVSPPSSRWPLRAIHGDRRGKRAGGQMRSSSRNVQRGDVAPAQHDLPGVESGDASSRPGVHRRVGRLTPIGPPSTSARAIWPSRESWSTRCTTHAVDHARPQRTVKLRSTFDGTIAGYPGAFSTAKTSSDARSGSECFSIQRARPLGATTWYEFVGALRAQNLAP